MFRHTEDGTFAPVAPIRNTGGAMVEKCCHFFDLMRLIVRDEAMRVFCSGNADVNYPDECYDGVTPDIIDDSFTTIDYARGVRAMLDLCMFTEGSEEQEVLVATGDVAKLEVSVPRGVITHSRGWRVGTLRNSCARWSR